MKEPQDPKVRHPLAGPRRLDYVIEVWVAEELRDRVRRNGISLAEASRSGRNRLAARRIRSGKTGRQSDHRSGTAGRMITGAATSAPCGAGHFPGADRRPLRGQDRHPALDGRVPAEAKRQRSAAAEPGIHPGRFRS